MRPGISFHDGSPLTAHDVAFSLKCSKKKGHPSSGSCFAILPAAEAPDDASVMVSFAQGTPATCRCSLLSVPIFSRTYYSGHPFEETTLEAPLGCGPYKVGQLRVGRFIEYERVKDWWGADLPVASRATQFRHRPL